MTDLLEQADQPQVQCTTIVADTSKTIFIYGLRCPVSGTIRYVGKSDKPSRRFRSHLCDDRDTHKTRWLRQLKDAGLEPKLEILESVSFPEWRSAERRWIEKLREIPPGLTNSTTGGYGPDLFLPHVRQRMSNSRKAWWNALTEDERVSIRHQMSERAKRLKGRKLTSEQIDRLVAANRGRKASEDTRRIQSENRTAWWQHLDGQKRKEFIEKRAASMRGRHVSSETREKIRTSQIGKVIPQSQRDRIGQANSRFWMSVSPSDREMRLQHLRVPWSSERRHKLSRTNTGRKSSSSTSQFKGVSWFKRDACWRAWINLEGRQKHLGYFPVHREEDAARAYDAAALRVHGEFAVLNFPVKP